MKKGAANQNTPSDDELQRMMAVVEAKNRFFASTLGMGWRLAITILVPLLAGVKLDQHFKTTPSLTLTGFMFAIAGGAAVVWNTVKEVNADQAADSPAEPDTTETDIANVTVKEPQEPPVDDK